MAGRSPSLGIVSVGDRLQRRLPPHSWHRTVFAHFRDGYRLTKRGTDKSALKYASCEQAFAVVFFQYNT